MADPTLQLRDIHQPPAPGWWPPAPGWWIVAAALLLLALAGAALAWRRRRRRRAIADLFDATVARALTPAAEVAAMSELLRRASRRIDPAADRLQGDAWLRFLDRGLDTPVFAAGIGAALREAPFRRDVSDLELDSLRAVTRDRFLKWMR